MSLLILWFYYLWQNYREQYKRLPVNISEDAAMLVKLNSHVAIFIEKYGALLKVALFISGIATFITSIMSILRNTH